MNTIIRAKTEGLFDYGSLTSAQAANVALNKKEAEEGKLVLQSAPQRLMLEVTTGCNLDCPMCGRVVGKFKPYHMSLDWFKLFEPVLDRVTEVTLFGWGEPTIYKHFREAVEYLSDFQVKQYFVTNGMLLDRWIDLIIKHISIVAVSVDGAKPETSNMIRKGGDWNKTMSNVRKLIEAKNAANNPRPWINFVMTAMRRNLHELPDLVRVAAALGVMEVKVVHLTAFTAEIAKDSLWNCQDEVRQVFNEAALVAEENGVLLKLPHVQGEDPAGDACHKLCTTPWRDLFLGSDGWTRPCMSHSKKVLHLPSWPDFWSAWNSLDMQQLRNSVNDERMMLDQCKNCYQSSFANWNRASSYNQTKRGDLPQWE